MRGVRTETLVHARSADGDARPCAECGRRHSSVHGVRTKTLVRARSANGDSRITIMHDGRWDKDFHPDV